METTDAGNSYGQAGVADGRLPEKKTTIRQAARKYAAFWIQKSDHLNRFIFRIESFFDLVVICTSCDISALRVILPCGRNYSTFALRA